MAAIEPQVDHTIVITHVGAGAEVDYVEVTPERTLIRYGEWPPNISRMWNLGLDTAWKIAAETGRGYLVAVLNDDAIVPPQWFNVVAHHMHVGDSVLGSMVPDVQHPKWLSEASPDLPRIAGYAFVLEGNGLRLDEQFQWWWGDSDLEWAARRTRGGVVLVPGEVEHLHPNSTTFGELAEIASQDRERFAAKYGRAPW